MVKRNAYDILDDTFCFYCQKDYVVNTDLQTHVLDAHPGTYGANSILKALEATLADPDAYG